jgi:hypothetical protein
MQVAVVVKLILTYCWPLKAGVSLIVLIELVQQFKSKKISSTTIKSELVRLLLRSFGTEFLVVLKILRIINDSYPKA